MRKGERRRESKREEGRTRSFFRIKATKTHTSFDSDTPGTYSAPAPPQSAS